jgi:hypothetical protein
MGKDGACLGLAKAAAAKVIELCGGLADADRTPHLGTPLDERGNDREVAGQQVRI